MAPRVDLSTLRLNGARLGADVSDAVTAVTIDRPIGALTELTIDVIDPDRDLATSPLVTPGTTIVMDDTTWIVAAVTNNFPASGPVTLSVNARGPLARALRRTYRSSVEQNVSPSDWVSRRVKAAGGTAVCMTSSKKATIAQSSGDTAQSQLDVLSSLASEIDGSFVERSSGRLWFGTADWAYRSAPAGQRTWPIDENYAASFTADSDDTEATGTGSIDIDVDAAARIQPWDLIQVSGFGTDVRGLWLVDGFTVEETARGMVSVPIRRPKPPRAKSGSAK